MLDPGWLAALSAIHRRGAFDLAAAELSVTPPAISQRIRALEERVGMRLIRRGQPCEATPEGLRLIRHFDEISLLERQLARDLPALSSGPAPLRIAVNADSLATWVLPALRACEGDFLFDLVIDDQDVSQDWLRRGEVMAAVTSHPGPLQGCDTVALGSLRYLATASPDFMARWFAGGITAAALARAPSLIYSGKDRLQQTWAARIVGPVTLPCHRIGASQAFVDAALLGLGWAMNPETLARAHINAGRLQEVVADSALDVALYWQFPRLVAPALAPLTRAIRQAAAEVLVPSSAA
ncbi:LysR family transcriptional regulator ArgP [Rhodobacter sp. 24-YEA-8]|uniref:LysR family transcriptional regulator ArgP n=1 Tax=Rhodobacter sp. 24-YEA-8 TaxID=1884310 RepID=UPI0008978473|nr:LysR family transcriptional regulator ArgP [Rhodobacter sp. 24-YEA-8]SEC45489.1 LysR family transcriptional regulator, chromosome initiation inhibitor [Rhodobacter sp. 24-YEA-8]